MNYAFDDWIPGIQQLEFSAGFRRSWDSAKAKTLAAVPTFPSGS